MSLRLILILFILSSPLKAQRSQTFEEVKQAIIEQRLELLSTDLLDEDPDFTMLFERLNTFYNRPVNLNQTNYRELKSLGLLTDIQINDIFRHIEKYGQLAEVEELQLIKSLDAETIGLIMPFVTIGESFFRDESNLIDPDNTGVLFIRWKKTLEKSKGYIEKEGEVPFEGSPYLLYTRFQFSYKNHLDFGFTAEKDPGEALFAKNQSQGFDFYSGFVALKDMKWLQKIIIGDYQAAFGQGLTFYTGSGIGKSSQVLLFEQTSGGIRPYKSSNEAQYLRGIAITAVFKNLSITPFASITRIDANLKESDSGIAISSFNLSGYHRTESELVKRRNNTSRIAGLNIAYENPNLTIGLTAAGQQVDNALNPDPDWYELHYRTEKEVANIGIYSSSTYRNFSFSGEYAVSLKYGKAFILGTTFLPDPAVAMSLSYRAYDKDYQPIYSAAFGENTVNRNEKGIYSSIVVKLTRKITWSTYADIYEFNWLKYRVSAPSSGSDYFTDINYSLSKQVEFYARHRRKLKAYDHLFENSNLPDVIIETRANTRLQLQMDLHENLRLRSRIEFSKYGHPEGVSNGTMFFEELKFQKKGWPLSFLVRYTLFDIDDYNSRIYTYEQDLPGIYAVPSFYGKGSRYFLLIHFKQYRWLDWWLKFGQTFYDNRTSIGSGNDEIQGPVRSDLSLQCRLRF